jgi:GntR family transcriptional regulator
VATLSAYAPRVQFHLDQRTGLPMYLQIVQQVKEALRLGLLDVGDQLPTVREVVASTAINPNTVAKAYRELERDGLVSATPGRGTFISNTLAADSLEHHETLRRELLAWIAKAKRAGMDDESVLALVSRTLHDVLGRRVA